MFDWFKIFNLNDYPDGLPSTLVVLDLEVFGERVFNITKGNLFGVVIDENFICANLNDENPSIHEGYALYVDNEDNLYIGFESSES